MASSASSLSRGLPAAEALAGGAPALQVASQEIVRATSGTSDMVFTLMLSAPVPYEVSVQVDTNA